MAAAATAPAPTAAPELRPVPDRRSGTRCLTRSELGGRSAGPRTPAGEGGQN